MKKLSFLPAKLLEGFEFLLTWHFHTGSLQVNKLLFMNFLALTRHSLNARQLQDAEVTVLPRPFFV